MKTSRGVLPLIAVILGTALMAWAFVNGISAALDGAGSNPPVFVILFAVGALLIVAAVVIAIVRLVRFGLAALPLATLVVAAVPVIAVIGLRLFAA